MLTTETMNDETAVNPYDSMHQNRGQRVHALMHLIGAISLGANG
jgi:hypothetical protein